MQQKRNASKMRNEGENTKRTGRLGAAHTEGTTEVPFAECEAPKRIEQMIDRSQMIETYNSG